MIDAPTQARLDIACVIATLRAGGAERVLCRLASELAAHGHRVRILTLAEAGEAPFYPLAGNVEVTNLGGIGSGASLNRPHQLWGASSRIRGRLNAWRPGLVLGFTTLGSMLAVIAARGLGLPVVAAERVDPDAHGRRIGKLRTAFRDALYARATHVVVQTERARQALAWLPQGRISVIVNAVAPIAHPAAPAIPGAHGRFCLLGIGRLDRQKGFDILIEAFMPLADRFLDWDLVIHGEGRDRSVLERKAGPLLRARRIQLPGTTREIESALGAAHALAFPSRYEGFPNALAEAMAAGLPAVAFRDVSGVEDLICARPAATATGLLADLAAPVETMRAQLAALMADPALRVHLGIQARRHVAAFSPQIHYERWERLLSRLAGSAHR